MSAALTDERLELIAVEGIADRAVADAVVTRRVVDRMGVRELSLCCLYTCEVEVALLCGRDRARDVLIRLGGHGIECAPRRCDRRTVQCACAFGEAALDLADDGGDLRHVVNLSVEHSTRLVFQALGGENVEEPLPLLGDNADDAARADVEREDEFRWALAARCGLHGTRIALLGAAALFCRRVLRLLLHAFFRAAALLRGCVCVYFFVCLIQIRHFDLP